MPELIFFVNKDGAKLEDDGKTLKVCFGAGIPRDSNESFEGVLTIPLPDGKPLKAESDTPADTPFTGALGREDKALNDIYTRLRQQLPADQSKALKTEQLQWIEERNELSRASACEQKADYDESEEQQIAAYRKARNSKALELTRARTAVLQQQLDAAH